MIKILIPGNIYRVTCDHCQAVLSYEKEDMQQTMIPVNDHLSHKLNTFIKCPQCENKIILEGLIV